MALVSRQNLFPTCSTVVVHLVIVASLFWSWHVMPPTLPPPQPSIKAKLIKMSAVPAKMRPKPVDKKAPIAPRNEPVEQPEPPKPEPKPPEPKPDPKKEEVKKQEEEKAISLAKKKEEEKKQAEVEKQKQEDLKKVEIEKKKQEEEKKKKDEEEKKKKEQEAKKKAEEQKKREADAKRKKLEAQRKAELARELSDEVAEDEQYLDAQADEEAAMSYMDVIREAVARNWSRPPSARNGMVVVLTIRLIPNGQVVDVSVATSSGSDAYDRSAVAAVHKAERFPELQELPSHVFDANYRQFNISFRPEDLRL